VQNDGADPVTFADGSSRFVYNGTALNEGTVFTVNNAIVSQTYQISYAGGTGNDIVLRVVPEPSVAYLVLGGIMAAWTRRRSPIS
jgi:hypothetical protein